MIILTIILGYLLIGIIWTITRACKKWDAYYNGVIKELYNDMNGAISMTCATVIGIVLAIMCGPIMEVGIWLKHKFD